MSWILSVRSRIRSSYKLLLQTRVTLLILYKHNDHWVFSFFLVQKRLKCRREGAGEGKTPIRLLPSGCNQSECP